ncbi:methionine synthase [Mycobacteroides salmoniphilum]|uniref:Cobalamin-independent synthase, Catalytic domain n=1 Tax=Mycobacteroides salmoniphilum TaxID=404941 RepID=A0A4R8T0L1_9MYCO|nr:methionine synthase [Mycobacteroides salmoniphilum]TDZ97873.1 Cobalamin-independent synthase, Catalytic domain [Mycobacteroides salmoniphilum]TEA09750.1 Cobalamin-independent synthase, Catalytic domain [Mycobacteroides salmoniphilum]
MNVWANGTGVGSWPGHEARAATEIVVAELPLPHIVELPARGVGADLIGRAAALLVDIAVDVVPTGYRTTARPGAVVRRARGFLDEDMDALEEEWERGGHRDSERAVKVQGPGPITLAAQLELPNGHRAITDPGAVRDLAASLAEGLALHQATLSRRLGVPVVVQLDEPSLPAALDGRLSGTSMFSPVHPVDVPTAISLLDLCAAAVGGELVVHCCAADPPWELLRGANIRGIAVDSEYLTDAQALDGLASVLDTGKIVILGVVPSAPPSVPISSEVLATRTAALADKLGFGRAVLRDRICISAGCGLAGADLSWARTATELTRKVSDLIDADPDAL